MDFPSNADPSPLPRLALSCGPGRAFPELAASYLVESLDKIRIALEPLDDEALWWRPAPGTNSAGNLVVHLAGNLSLWILDGVGGRPYQRDRAGEFAADRSAGSKEEVLERLAGVVEECGEVLAGLDQPDLSRPVHVQGYDVDVLAAIFHPVEHMSYHAGQIVWIAKQHLASRGEDLFELYPQHTGE